MSDTAAPSNPPNDQQRQIIVNACSQHWLIRAFAWMGWVGCIVFFFLLIGLTAAYSDYFDTTGGITEKFHSGEKYGSDKVAVIAIEGVIMEGDGYVKRQIERIQDDSDVKAIVIRVNSPGGTVTGSDYIFHHLTKLREETKLPIVVSMGSMATSGGYYVAMSVGDQEDSIYAEPTTTTGSIGVIIPHYDVSGLMERYDVVDDSISSHPRKQMLTMTRAMPEDHRKILQAYVDESFGRFKDIVKMGRPIFAKDPEALDQLATGEIFTATQAEKFGLVDKIGFIEDAIERAISLANLNKDDVRVIKYNKPKSFLDLPTLAMQSRGKSQMQLMLEMSSPRAYFITTSVPPLVSSWLK